MNDFLNILLNLENKKIKPGYDSRESRNFFAATQLKRLAVSSILNVGSGGKRHLQMALDDPNISIFDIDVFGDCDLTINLDEVNKLPFEDGAFDCVCSFDVLEHIENFHLINSEIMRISSKYVLISLPNSLQEIYAVIFRRNYLQEFDHNENGVFSKFYGLPLKPPSDRHRWWLYIEDIVRYYHTLYAKTHSIEFWYPSFSLKENILSLIIGKKKTMNFFTPYIWVLLEKK